jgi:hypothetical protein
MLEVVVTMDPDDFAALRVERRNRFAITAGADCQNGPWVSPYTYFPADVTINGDLISNVGVRKKGWFGSVNPTWPSLKLNLDYYVPGQEYKSVEDVTLHNGHQFGTPFLNLNQCFGYYLFEMAGLPAPRCNFAHVTVNGEDLGVYAHVERVRGPMLKRNFEDGSGVVWEGTVSDFRPGWVTTFEQKNDEETPYRAPLEELMTVLEQPNSAFIQQIDDVLHVDQYMKFWAMEVLIGHWDGYSGHANNFLVYHEPLSDLLHFIPWGIDATFNERNNPTRRIVRAVTTLPRKLYQIPTMRARYIGAVAEILDTVWDEETLIAEIDRMEAVQAPYIVDDPNTPGHEPTIFAARNQSVRNYVLNRRAFLEPLIANPPELNDVLRVNFCKPERGTFVAQFTTTWQNWANLPLDPTNLFTPVPDLEFDNVTYTVTNSGAVAGDSGDANFPVGLKITVERVNAGNFGVVVTMKDGAAVTGVDIPVDWGDAKANYAGWLQAGGTIRFDSLDRTPGGVVSGTLTLSLY